MTWPEAFVLAVLFVAIAYVLTHGSFQVEFYPPKDDDK